MPSWVSWSMTRLGNRSAITPAYGESSRTGQELQPGGDAELGAAGAGQAEDQPVLRDALHPGAGVRHHAAGEVQPVVAVAQRAEGGAQLSQSLRTVVAGSGRRRGGRRAPRAVRSRSWRASHSSRRVRSARTRSRPCSVRLTTTTTRPSVSWARRDDVAALLEAVDLAGHASAAAPARGAASSPTVRSPWRKQAPEHGHRSRCSGRCPGSRSLASRRRSRITDTRSSDARPASVRATFSTVGMYLA